MFNYQIDLMENFEAIDTKVLSIANGEIVKRKQSTILPMVVGGLGLLLSIVSTEGVALLPEGAARSAGLYVGIALLLAGFVMLCRRKEIFYHVPTNESMLRLSFNFDVKDADKVSRLYEKGDFSGMLKLCVSYNAGMQLNAICNMDASLCFTQLAKFVPYSFVPCTEVRKHDNEEAVKTLVSK